MSIYFHVASDHLVLLISTLLLSFGVAYSVYFWIPWRCTIIGTIGIVVVLTSYSFCLIPLSINLILGSSIWGVLLGNDIRGVNANFALAACTLFLVTVGNFFALSVVYSISTTILFQVDHRPSRDGVPSAREGGSFFDGDLLRYGVRRNSQVHFGWIFRAIAGLSLLGLFPAVLVRVGEDVVTGTSIFVVLLTSLVLVALGERLLGAGVAKSNLTLVSGSFIFLFGFAMFAFYVAGTIVEPFISAIRLYTGFRLESLPDSVASIVEGISGTPSPPTYRVSAMVSHAILAAIVATYCLVVGILVSLNYSGIHRIFRDRLMELFLPDHRSVRNQRWGPATQADSVLIENVCRSPNGRPYHLLNANVVLVDSLNEKYRERGGANFIMSPLYCGSDATGWRRSFDYMREGDSGLRLATAMAISAAAANPHSGSRRSAGTRNRMVSLAMSILNLRLGYWAPHPDPNQAKGKTEIPNYLFPGVIPALGRGFLSEHRRFVDLTDGGHFENLGLYELVRRRLKVIMVCDSSYDPGFEYADLAIAIERIKVDFGVQIRFRDDHGLNKLEPSKDGGTSERGFAIADIVYAAEGGDSRTSGTLVYLKPTILRGLSPEIVSYRRRNVDFPNEATANQFFHEAQFEAYRELGYAIGRSAIADLADLFRNL